MSKKNITCVIILLFIGAGFVPSISGNIRNHDSINYGTFDSILVYITEDGSGYIYDKSYFNYGLPMILENAGYSIHVTDRETITYISDALLEPYDELWILSTNPYSWGCFSYVEINSILKFRNDGNGLLIAVGQQSDGQNYQADGNQISAPLGVTFYGIGDHSPPGGETVGEITPIFANHPLSTGVRSIVGCIDEGMMDVQNNIEIVATYNGDDLIAVLDDGKGRVVFDVNEQRFWDPQPPDRDWILDGDTPQYVRNIADWLKNNQPNTPSITGPVSGKAGEEYDFTFKSVDPNGNNVQFYIEWGDGNESTEFFGSGEEMTISHSWNEKNEYIIRAKAIDTRGGESDWATLEVSMPKNKMINPFEIFFENHPNMFPILRKIFD